MPGANLKTKDLLEWDDERLHHQVPGEVESALITPKLTIASGKETTLSIPPPPLLFDFSSKIMSSSLFHILTLLQPHHPLLSKKSVPR
jgi:hypothetical protein